MADGGGEWMSGCVCVTQVAGQDKGDVPVTPITVRLHCQHCSIIETSSGILPFPHWRVMTKRPVQTAHPPVQT
jgi:hypothetical protein